MIGQCSVLDGYKEIIKINKISTEKEVTVGNGKEIKSKKLYNVDLSFGQVNKFDVKTEEISFTFIGFTTEPLNKDKNISMIVNLIKNENELVEEEAICIALENVEPKDGKQLKAEFECKVEK